MIAIDYESAAILCLIAVIWAVLSTIIVWKWIVPFFFGKYVRKTLVQMFSKPDEETKIAVANLAVLIMGSEIRTGKKVKNSDGEEIDEVLPLYRMMGRELSNYMMLKLKSMRGGAVANAGDKLEDDLGAGIFASLGPRKNQTTMDWAIEQAIPRVMPRLEKMLADLIEKKGM